MARRKKEKPVKFVNGSTEESNAALSHSAIVDQVRTQMAVKQQQGDILAKSVKPVTIRKNSKHDKNKIVYSTRELGTSSDYDGVESKGWRRLSDNELKEVSTVDPYISAIISTRCSQGAVIGRPSDSKFDKGTRVMELKPLKREDFESDDAYDASQSQREKHMKTILNWMLSCGTSNEEILNTTYKDSDPLFKKCSLSDYIASQVRNLMTFGRYGSQIFRNDDSMIDMFRPVPIETIYNIRSEKQIFLSEGDNTQEQSSEDAKTYNQLEEDQRPTAYVQKVDGRICNFFTDQDLKVGYLQKQALFDLSGYPLAPIEQAIYMVFTHQQTLQYLRNSYVKGLGNKGILVIASTDPAAQLSNEDLDQLRREFHNFVSRNDNSATTPVLSGPVEVKFVALSPSPKDMEFLQVEEHVIRALCSAFQISPQEMGYGHLSMPQGGLTQANKQEDIIRGEERGLRMLLDVVYDGLNEILYENFPEAKDLYRIVYTGVGEDTRDAITQRNNQELATTATLSSLYADSERTDVPAFGGDVPLSPLYHESVVKYMKYGEVREFLFGEENASRKPEYDFIVDATLNQSYQSLRVQPVEMQKEQAAMQMGAMQQEMAGGAQQMQHAESAHQSEQEAAQQAQVQQAQQPQEGQEQPVESPAEKSLAEEYAEREKLQKSLNLYFKSWLASHQK